MLPDPGLYYIGPGPIKLLSQGCGIAGPGPSIIVPGIARPGTALYRTWSYSQSSQGQNIAGPGTMLCWTWSYIDIIPGLTFQWTWDHRPLTQGQNIVRPGTILYWTRSDKDIVPGI